MAETTLPTKPKFKIPLIEGAWQNPVVLKELRGRMRGARAFILIFVYLMILSCILGLVYAGFLASTNATGSTGPDFRQAMGKTIFLSLSGIELMMVCFIAPALTAGSISTEREHQTYDLLRTTLLTARSLVFGKYMSALSFILLLLVAAFPLQSLAASMGGVAIEEVIISFLILVVTAVAFSAVGLFYSSIFRRTLASTVLAYASALILLFGLPILIVFGITFFSATTSGNIAGNLNINQQVFLELLIIVVGWLLIALNPFASGIATELMLIDKQNAFIYQIPLSNGNNFPVIGPWMGYLVFYLIIALALILLSVVFVKRTEK